MADTEEVVAELKGWLEENWDPDLTVAQWWDRLGTSGWAAPTWPADAYGKGLTRAEAVAVQRTIREFGALGAPGGLGLLLAGPTIATHGTPEQKATYLKDIVTGQKAWCQLFSEPGAGSDLAGLGTKALKDGDEWIINGQKVWTSGGQVADLGMLLARTDADVPKHNGISYFAFDMHQPGVEVRPLREMTGRAMFNEVFITDGRVADDACIGDVGNGWKVANTTLAFERAGLGAGGGSESGSAATPGTVAGDLPRRAGDFVRTPGRRRGEEGAGVPTTMLAGAETLLTELAKGNGKIKDPTVRQDLAQLHIRNEIGRFMMLRLKGGADIPGAGNMAKLSMSDILRLQRDLGLRILGPVGALHAYNPKDRKALDAATGNPFAAAVTEMALFSPGPSIYGGTDQVQRNIIGERVLGLPKEPSNDRVLPFKELPKNG
ncbi:MAG: acyl-CoA dehydrogenase family protein [Acidimicrobiales bacterium]